LGTRFRVPVFQPIVRLPVLGARRRGHLTSPYTCWRYSQHAPAMLDDKCSSSSSLPALPDYAAACLPSAAQNKQTPLIRVLRRSRAWSGIYDPRGRWERNISCLSRGRLGTVGQVRWPHFFIESDPIKRVLSDATDGIPVRERRLRQFGALARSRLTAASFHDAVTCHCL